MPRPFLLLALTALALPLHAQEVVQGLTGHLDNGTYFSPTGAFTIESPAAPELGGTITDTERVVTFMDDFTTLISIGAFPRDATQRWELSTRGLKDYLLYFFGNFVVRDFRRVYPETHAEENARFLPTEMGGALITFVLMPGGSMFAARTPTFTPSSKPPVAKRGNMLFSKNGYTFVISIELAERITEGVMYGKTSEEEDAILRKRLIAIASKMRFPNPPAESPAP